MKYLSVVTVIAVALLSNACNSGSSRKTGGRQCPEKYDPIPMTAAKGQSVVSMDPAAKQLTPGIYEYAGATAYFMVKSTDLRVEVTDAKDPKSQAYKAGTSCVRNATGELAGSFEVQGLSKLEVGRDFKTFISTRAIGFTANKGLKASSSDKLQKVEQAPGKAYQQGEQVMMIKKSDTSYEVRSTGTDGKSTYFLVVRLTRKNL